MTWVKLTDSALEDPRLLVLPRGAILMHLEALAYSNRHNLGGRIPRVALRKLTTEEDPEAAAASLVDAEFWKPTDNGWQLVWLLDDQPTEDEVEATRKRWREAQATTRRRRELHLSGDHSICDPRRCRVLLRGRVSADVSDDVSDESSLPPTPIRLRPDHEEGRRGGGAAGARSRRGGARAARREGEVCFHCANPAPDGLELIDRDGLRMHPQVETQDGETVPPGWEPYLDEWGALSCPPAPNGYDRCTKCDGAYPVDQLRTAPDPLTYGVMVVSACAPCWRVLEVEVDHDCAGGIIFDGPGRAHHRELPADIELEPSGLL